MKALAVWRSNDDWHRPRPPLYLGTLSAFFAALTGCTRSLPSFRPALSNPSSHSRNRHAHHQQPRAGLASSVSQSAQISPPAAPYPFIAGLVISRILTVIGADRGAQLGTNKALP